MRRIERRNSLNSKGGRPFWDKPTTVQQLIDRVTPFVGYIEACGMDEIAYELEAALDGDDPEAECNGFGTPFAPGGGR